MKKLPGYSASTIKNKKTITTHDNGSRPFKVDIYTDHFKVYKNTTPAKQLISKKYIQVFIGRDKNIKGSSVLFQITKSKYIYVGATITEYIINDNIQKYYSEVGNSDVVYPYAIGTKNVYMLLESAFIPLEKIVASPYEQLYGFNEVKYEKNFIVAENKRKKIFKNNIKNNIKSKIIVPRQI